MKIERHLKAAFTSPLGNILAIVNVAMLSFVDGTLIFRPGAYEQLVCDLNAPAVLASVILTGKLTSFALLPPLVYLQRISIASVARIIAAKIRPEPA